MNRGWAVFLVWSLVGLSIGQTFLLARARRDQARLVDLLSCMPLVDSAGAPAQTDAVLDAHARYFACVYEALRK